MTIQEAKDLLRSRQTIKGNSIVRDIAAMVYDRSIDPALLEGWEVSLTENQQFVMTKNEVAH